MNVKSSCNRRGCEVGIILPHDSRFKSVRMGMFSGKHDFPKVLPFIKLSLDKKLEKEEQMEKKAA